MLYLCRIRVMNRKIAIVPLMFACMMLMAHLAVPHHHHHGTIICLLNYSDEIVAEANCFDTHHHEDDDAGTNNHEGTDSHKNSNDESEEHCFMDDLYLLADSKHSVELVPVETGGFGQFFLRTAILQNFPNIIPELPCRKKPFLISYQSLLNSDASGLRGPPIS